MLTDKPVDSDLVGSCLRFSKTSKCGWGGKRSQAILTYTTLSGIMHTRMWNTPPVSLTWVTIARYTALFYFAFHTARCGIDLTFSFGNHVLQLPDGTGPVFNFCCGRTLRSCTDEFDAVLTDDTNPETCAVKCILRLCHRSNLNLRRLGLVARFLLLPGSPRCTGQSHVEPPPT